MIKLQKELPVWKSLKIVQKDKEKIQNAVSEDVKSKDIAKTVTELVSFDITITDADGNDIVDKTYSAN